MKTFLSEKAIVAAVTASVLFIGCKKHDGPGGYPPHPSDDVNAVVKSTAGDSNSIVGKLDEFRLLAGNPLNTAPGANAGRREVNWDAVPAALTNANNFPFDFFGAVDANLPNGRKRGLVLTNTATSFRVDSTSFSSIESSYASQFKVFSKKRLFAYMGNTITQVTFKVPGTATNAFVKSFGVIFCDVDDAYSSSVEYYSGAKSLGVYYAKTATQGFSFIGVKFPDEKVTMVKITSGNAVLATGVKDLSNGGNRDLVVMDDFIYDEPKPL